MTDRLFSKAEYKRVRREGFIECLGWMTRLMQSRRRYCESQVQTPEDNWTFAIGTIDRLQHEIVAKLKEKEARQQEADINDDNRGNR